MKVQPIRATVDSVCQASRHVLHFGGWQAVRVVCLWLVVPGGVVASSAPSIGTRSTVTFGQHKSVELTTILPKGYSNDKKFPVILVLPPGDGSADLVKVILGKYWNRAPRERGYVVVAMQVFGPKLKTQAAEMLPAVFEWMGKNLSYDPKRVVLTGASNGGRGAMLAAVSVPNRFAAVIIMPGAFVGDADKLQMLKGKPVWLLVGGNDTTWRGFAHSLKTALDAAGAITKLDILDHQTHVLTIPQDTLIDWVDDVLAD